MKIIFVFAHPDDESFSSGGTIAKLGQKGIEVKLITATKGEKGQLGIPPITTREKAGEVREQELRKAAKILGISEIFFLGFIDGELINLQKGEISKKILEILEKELPDIVVTFNEEGGSKHPDHIQINKSATQAFNKYMETAKKHTKLYYTAIPESFIKKLNKKGFMYTAYGKVQGTPDSIITTAVDVSETIKIKIEALKCHLTQKKDWERYLKRLEYKEFKHEFFRLVSENNFT
ncbi:PIG-L family deacetylase [Candidatus Microgenomates bacterium]|nr:MAG: PIG-L family deacetylase [Candidatus Microgenomates bacterium]